jgi:hypothetical protein
MVLGVILIQKYIISSTTLIRLAPRKSPAAAPVDTEIRSTMPFFLLALGEVIQYYSAQNNINLSKSSFIDTLKN